MKTSSLALTIISLLAMQSLWAAEGCRWSDNGGTEFRVVERSVPASIALAKVNIGGVMAKQYSGSAPAQAYGCQPVSTYPTLEYGEYVTTGANGGLADGFSNVYKTNLKGVGVRFSRNSTTILPYSKAVANANNSNVWQTNYYIIEFIRTAREVETGTLHYDHKLELRVMGASVMEGLFIGSTKVSSPNYFSGCSGVENLNINMGQVLLRDLAKFTPKEFNLDVLCEGLPAGTKLPVKIYFEGNSPGAGRLNLQPGGAEGVEISLTNDRKVKLPFIKGSALSMAWTRSEASGEIYRLPIVAQYVKSGSADIVPGRADAILNYILEYN
ncbi:hypothetical protein IB274_29280 [Pseudomonas sp. PDM18]|uniref:fimbrial protein n=1 Tax=Pseudomonas sp. PDM18 TaxID=2769253 RepID=UPI00177F63F0|nr:fimbrial protein [Pseudomonas sp. PDM18]MBD9680830.1 hypothetical protein [Pseudomonas sp. PDM18]